MVSIKTACVQITSGTDIAGNLKMAEGFIREAAVGGAQFIVTPENTCQMRHPSEKKLETAPLQDDHPGVPFFSALAKELGVWILIGSLSIKRDDGRIANRSFLFSDQGDIAATYDKIHMFDVQLSGGEVYKESDVVAPGADAVVAQTSFGKVGLSICYDLRFPHFYRDMAKAGAEIMAVPAAFTVPTGKAHWKVLLRARAIETGSFVIASGQTGEHENGRQTWGHSVIISPWGEVLAERDEKSGIIIADLNLDDVAKARGAIPALAHDRDYTVGR